MTDHHIPEEHQEKPSRAIIVAIQTPKLSEEDVLSSCAELERLANTLGITVVATETQRRPGTGSSLYLGSGKLRELATMTGGPGEPGLKEGDETAVVATGEPIADMVLVDGELSPRQQRNLELALNVPVIDRTAVILEIFEERAQTKEAKLQVEIARLKYEIPRLREGSGSDDRQGGGGRGARGHTNVELARSRIRDRIAQLTRDLEDVRNAEELRRERRQDTFQVALVGYTNAGKSSLMRALTGSEVLVEDKLFATLGTTIRQLQPPVTPQVLISDTVGFIKNLPHELVASFRSTLEEAKEADHLLLVVDSSDPDWPRHLEVTEKTLESIGAGDVPRSLVFNKIDCLSESDQNGTMGGLRISALNPEDVTRLHEHIVNVRDAALIQQTLTIPYAKGQILGEVYNRSQVLSEEHTEAGTVVTVRARRAELDRWQQALNKR